MIRFFQIMLVLTITLFTVSAVETQWKTWVPEELPPRHSFASIWVEGENFTSTNSDKTFTNNGAGVLKDKACYGGAIYHISNHRPIPADGYQVRYEFEVENSGEYLLAVAGSLPSQ